MRSSLRVRGGAGRHHSPSRPARTGLTIVEVVVALSVMVVAASIFCQMLISTTRVRQLNRENALAADAARVALERMRNVPFLEIYRAYNEDPSDDPGGSGTGPGYLFDVEGLQPVDGAPQGKVGRITFPSKAVEVTTSNGGTGGLSGGGKIGLGGGGGGAGGGTTTKTVWQLREEVVDVGLGMPRDLNGDNVVTESDRSKDYLLLPVRVRIEWKGGGGTRKFEIVTQLGDFRQEPAP